MNRRHLVQLLSVGAVATFARSSRAVSQEKSSTDWIGNPTRDARLRFSVDVAVLGHTDAQNTAGRLGDPKGFLDTDARGDVFYVEGALYRGGTIPKPKHATGQPAFPQAPAKLNNEVVWDFKGAQPVGHWADRGWVLFNGSPKPYTDRAGTVIDPQRMEPRLLSEQTFVFGRFDSAHLSPEMLMTSGVENGVDADHDTVVRAVTGGTGRFKYARGEVIQSRLGRNTSNLRSLAKVGVGAPNFHFEFDLKLS